MSREGLGPLVRIEGSFTASCYSALLQDTMIPYVLDGPFPDGCFIFQQDRSPVHMARQATTLLEDLGVRTLQWPPNGADANPIENVWGVMKSRLSRRHLSGGTADALWTAIREEWDSLRANQEFVVSLYKSMPKRMSDIISAGGYFTHY